MLGAILLAFLVTFPYKSYHNNHIFDESSILIDKINIEKTRIDSLKKCIDSSFHQWDSFFNSYNKTFPNDPYDEAKLKERLGSFAENDSIKNKWSKWGTDVIKFNKSLGYNNPEAFKKFTKNISMYTYYRRNSKIKLANKEIEILRLKKEELMNKKMGLNDQLNILGLISLSLFILLFILRYFYLGLKWSIAILKLEN